MRKGEPYIYELKLYDNRSWPLTEREYNDIKQKIKDGKKMLEMPDTSLIAVSNIASVPKRQLTMADWGNDTKALPEGERVVDIHGPGYQKFVQAARKFSPRWYRNKMFEWGMDEDGQIIDQEKYDKFSGKSKEVKNG